MKSEKEIRAKLKTIQEEINKSLEKSSLELCSKLRVAVGLSPEFDADETALINLDGFLADLANEKVDSSELVRAARKRL
ncbi:MAG: hypothetical protein ACTSV7_13465 [Candidatus Baldrarchaeia archaeon]